MPRRSPIIPLALCIGMAACAQREQTMENTAPPLLCDTLTGACAIPPTAVADTSDQPVQPFTEKPITLLYFTDPICSSCWGAEPQLRRLKLEYGDAIDIQYRMGGLLPSWEVYNSGGISKPSDVAGHWEEVSPHYRMPIVGDVWLTDPLPSSYPPSIAFKAAELQDHAAALVFLRRLREEVFVEARNITRWEVIADAARFAGLDTARLHADFDGVAAQLFRADLALARSLGVRGFPTFIFSNADGERQQVYGARAYAELEAAVKALAPELRAAPVPEGLSGLLDAHASWCAQEVAVLLGIAHGQAQEMLQAAERDGMLTVLRSRNGNVWRQR